MKYKNLKTEEVLAGHVNWDYWPDRSLRTVAEHAEQHPGQWQLVQETTPANQAEIFDLACRIACSFAQAGINFDPSTCMDKAKELYKLKEKL